MSVAWPRSTRRRTSVGSDRSCRRCQSCSHLALEKRPRASAPFETLAPRLTFKLNTDSPRVIPTSTAGMQIRRQAMPRLGMCRSRPRPERGRASCQEGTSLVFLEAGPLGCGGAMQSIGVGAGGQLQGSTVTVTLSVFNTFKLCISQTTNPTLGRDINRIVRRVGDFAVGDTNTCPQLHTLQGKKSEIPPISRDYSNGRRDFGVWRAGCRG